MNAVIAFPHHRVSRRRAPLHNEVVAFVRPEREPDAVALSIALARLWIAFAGFYAVAWGIRP